MDNSCLRRSQLIKQMHIVVWVLLLFTGGILANRVVRGPRMPQVAMHQDPAAELPPAPADPQTPADEEAATDTDADASELVLPRRRYQAESPTGEANDVETQAEGNDAIVQVPRRKRGLYADLDMGDQNQEDADDTVSDGATTSVDALPPELISSRELDGDVDGSDVFVEVVEDETHDTPTTKRPFTTIAVGSVYEPDTVATNTESLDDEQKDLGLTDAAETQFADTPDVVREEETVPEVTSQATTTRPVSTEVATTTTVEESFSPEPSPTSSSADVVTTDTESTAVDTASTTNSEGVEPVDVPSTGTTPNPVATPPARTPATWTLTIENPHRIGYPVSFLYGNELIELQPGDVFKRSFASSQEKPLLVQFNRGGDFGDASMQLKLADYQFNVTRKGWQVIPRKPSKKAQDADTTSKE